MENKRKIHDILPPGENGQKFDAVRSIQANALLQPSLKRRRLWPIGRFLIFSALFAGIVMFGAHFFFASATVVAWPETRELEIGVEIEVAPSFLQTDLQARRIPGTLLSEEFEETRRFSASGEAHTEAYARGTITVFNRYSTEALPLRADTRFISEDGQLFRSHDRVVVPGASRVGGELVPGEASVQVQAAEPGEEYNIGSSFFSLPGLAGTALYDHVFGESSSSMQGGAIGEVRVVTRGDLEQAERMTLASLKERAEAEFRTIAPPGFTFSENSLQTIEMESESNAQEGEAWDMFEYAVRTEEHVVAYRRSDLRHLATLLFELDLQEGENLNANSMLINTEFASYDSELQILRLVLTGTAQAYARIDEQELRTEVLGKTKDEAHGILERTPGIARTDVFIWPFWREDLPSDISKINFEFRLE